MATISASAGHPPAEAETSRYAKWAIALFFVVLFIPGSFYIGVRMTPYRLYLIAMAIPTILRFREDPTLRLTAMDVLVFLSIFWRSFSILINHQLSEVANAGSSFLELFFGYMLGRVFIRTEADYRFFFRCFLVTLVAFLPFALLELTTRRRILRMVAGVVLSNPPTATSDQIRYGLMRVMVSFDHAIQFGYFCAVGFVNVYYIYYKEFFKKLVIMGFVGFMALMSLSSGPFLVLFLQCGMIVYEFMFRLLRFKWIILLFITATVWFSFELLFSMTIPEYIVSNLVYNTTGANGRLDQITFGLQEVYDNPVFGIGLEAHAHAFWRSPSIDNFYLSLAIRSGLPAVAFFVTALVVLFIRAGFANIVSEEAARYRIGYLIALACLVLALVVTYIWGVSNVFLMLYIGAGAWFFNGAELKADNRRVNRSHVRRVGPAHSPMGNRRSSGQAGSGMPLQGSQMRP